MKKYFVKNNKCLAFTLTEVAIVLGVIGIVLGAIWPALGMVQNAYKANVLKQQLTIFYQNANTLFATQTVAAAGSGPGAWALTDQACPGAPCSTEVMIQAGVFPPGFMSSVMVSPTPWGFGGSAFQTMQGYPIWTGVYDCGLYATGVPGECAHQTVMEVDFYDMTTTNCTQLLMAVINAKLTNLINIEAPNQKWGTVTGGATGLNFPSTIDPVSASNACAAPTNGSFLWFIFSIG